MAHRHAAWKRRTGKAVVDWLLAVEPSTAFQIAGILRQLTDRWTGSRPLVWPEEIRALFGDLPRDRLIEIAREIRAVNGRNSALGRLIRGEGLGRIGSAVHWHGADRLLELHADRRPVILMTWHLGAYLAVVAGLHQVNLPTLFVARPIPTLTEVPIFEVCDPSGGPARAAAALKRALAYLREGGLVSISADGRVGSGVAVPCLGRRITLRRGPAWLARLSGAPIMPLVAHWERGGRTLAVVLHEPLPQPASSENAGVFEQAVTRDAARWLDTYLRSAPHQLLQDRLQEFLAAPLAETSRGLSPVGNSPDDAAVAGGRATVDAGSP